MRASVVTRRAGSYSEALILILSRAETYLWERATTGQTSSLENDFFFFFFFFFMRSACDLARRALTF